MTPDSTHIVLAPNQDLSAGIQSATLKKVYDPHDDEPVWLIRVHLAGTDTQPPVDIRGAGYSLREALMQAAMSCDEFGEPA